MKKIRILLVGVLTLSILNCFAQKTDLKKLNLSGKISSINEKTYQPIISEDVISKGRMVQWHRNVFNSMGNKVEDLKFRADSSIDKKYVYSYTNEGFRKDLCIYSGDNLLTLKIEYKYDSEGRLLKDVSFNDKGQIEKEIAYLYGKDDFLTEVNILNPNGELQKKVRYVYSSSGFMAESNQYKANGELERRITYLQDLKGNNIEEKTYSFEGILLTSVLYKYEYDVWGNWIKKTSFSNEKPVSITERKIIYF
ncbi:MAG: hypothetical protein IPF68_01240 [Bacteroidales bacterium]|nr:hypothetical protein [Bacteroidales bacterium]